MLLEKESRLQAQIASLRINAAKTQANLARAQELIVKARRELSFHDCYDSIDTTLSCASSALRGSTDNALKGALRRAELSAIRKCIEICDNSPERLTGDGTYVSDPSACVRVLEDYLKERLDMPATP